MTTVAELLSKLMSFPMGGGTFGRYFNGLIHGGGAIAALFLLGVIVA